MRARFAGLLILFLFSAARHPAVAEPVSAEAARLIGSCREKAAGQMFHYHRCLIEEYERIEGVTDKLTDRLLGIIGGNRELGRLRIIQWSNAITQSQSQWKKYIIWDCEWGGHLEQGKPGAAAVMTECRIERALERQRELEARATSAEAEFAAAAGKAK